MEIQTVLSLLTLTSQEATIIGELNSCFRFDHNIILSDSSINVNEFVRNESQAKSLLVFDNVDESTARLNTLMLDIESKCIFLIVVLKNSRLERNLHMLTVIKNTPTVGTIIKIGIFFQTHTSMYDIRRHLQWFKGHFIATVFAATRLLTSRSLNLFTFHSFGNSDVMNVTRRETCEQILPSLDTNYHQHKFRVMFANLFCKQFWTTVLTYMNATYETHYAYYRRIEEYLSNGVDILPGVISLYRKQSRFLVYPISLAQQHVIVPESEPYSGFNAYL